MVKCLACGNEILKSEDFSLGGLSRNLCAQCSKPRVAQRRIDFSGDIAFHEKFGQKQPPSEREIHEAYRLKLRKEGKSEEAISRILKKWHTDQAA